MTTQNDTAVKGCPYAAARAAEPRLHVKDDAARLYTFAEVEQTMAREHPLAMIAAWMRRFLARPHPELGRGGPVCPFVPGAISQDTIWLAAVNHGSADREAIKELAGRYREIFLDLEPKNGEGAMMKSILIVFPNVTTENAGIIDEVQLELKPQFVDSGLMLGEFHELNQGQGLRNPDFRPLRSPVPLLAIRFMVESDIPFLHRMMYPPALRARLIKSYIRRLGTTVNKNTFDIALEALVAAEIQMRTNDSVEIEAQV
jgi:hypothetical protein